MLKKMLTCVWVFLVLAAMVSDNAWAQGVVRHLQQQDSRGGDMDDEDHDSGEDTSDCLRLSHAGGGHVFMTNTCGVPIIVKFCWQSSTASCSCSKKTKCGTSAISPGRHEMITGPGHDRGARLMSSVCDYREWKAGRCKLVLN